MSEEKYSESQKDIISKLIESCEELTKAMINYEMDVDCDPPYEHRKMMNKAQKAISDAQLSFSWVKQNG